MMGETQIETPTQTVQVEQDEHGVWLRILSTLDREDDPFFDGHERWVGDSVWLGDPAQRLALARALLGDAYVVIPRQLFNDHNQALELLQDQYTRQLAMSMIEEWLYVTTPDRDGGRE